LAGADDPVMLPDGDIAPLPLLDDRGIGLLDQAAHPGQHLAAPVTELLDPAVDELRGRLAHVAAPFCPQLGASTPNCFEYSAARRCQPSNFIASMPTIRPIGAPARNRSITSKQTCQPAAPHAMKPLLMLWRSVRRVPLPSGSSSQRRLPPPQLNSSSRGASARVTLVSDTCFVGAPTVVSFTGPAAARLWSASNGAHCVNSAGSV